jgi:hypothetical protein
MVNFAQIGTTAAAAVAPFIIAASPAGALAGECKQAPVLPPQSSLLSNPSPKRAYITDLSQPVLIADANPSVVAQGRARPNALGGNGTQIMNQLIEEAQQNQRCAAEKLRNIPPPPGSN